jgi:PAS domain S-box-containing protein
VRSRPALHSRFVYLIAIQVTFIFAALALILFYPQQRFTVGDDMLKMEGRYEVLTRWLSSQSLTMPIDPSQPSGSEIQAQFANELLQFDDILYGEVFVTQPDGLLYSLLSYSCDQPGADSLAVVSTDGPEVDARVVRSLMERGAGFMIPAIHSSDYATYYYRFDLFDSMPAVLVVGAGHDWHISQRSDLVYALGMLLLVSILVALLTAYFVDRKFKDPIRRLIHGLRSTRDGRLHQLVETGGDGELRELEQAYNEMAQSLWTNQSRLREANQLHARTNAVLTQWQTFLGTLIDHTVAGVMTVSADGTLLLYNRRAQELLGWEADEVLGKSVEGLFDEKSFQRLGQMEPGAKECAFEVLCRTREDELFPAYLTVVSLQHTELQMPAWLLLVRDISESKSFQEMMIRIDRYYTRGEMVGDIAHEINNYLAILQGNIELMPLLMKKGKTEKIEQKLELMKATVARITRFSDGLLDHEDEMRFYKTDLNQLIQNLMAFLRPQNRFDDVEIEIDLSAELPLVALDVAAVQQILVNLLHNGADATRGQSGRKLAVRTRPGPGHEAVVEVCDNGPGVPEKMQPKLFDQQFTTKRKAIGFGLLTCRKLVELHGGEIGYECDGGACFRFTLPIDQMGEQVESGVLAARILESDRR